MKKIIFLTIAIFLLFTQASYAVVSENLLMQKTDASSSAKEAVGTKVEQTQTQNLQARAQTEITRRIKFLNEFANKIDSLKKISDSDKTALKTQIQQQVSGLTVLQSKINADTDLATLKTDVKSIVNNYYIFAFFRVKISLLVAADRLSASKTMLEGIYSKLQTRVADLKNQGENTTSLEALLSDMRKKIDDADLQFQNAQNTLSQLEAQDYPKNKTTLTTARNKIKLGATDLKNALEDATKIRQELVKLGEKLNLNNNASGSAAVDN